MCIRDRALDDATIVVNVDQSAAAVTPAPVPAQVEDAVSGETIVVTGDETVVVVADATIVVPVGNPQRRRDRRVTAQSSLQDSVSSNPAPPIEDTHHNRDLRYGVGAGLDSDRPIAPVPGSMPWDAQPSGERGLSPVSYTHLDVYKRQVWACSRSNR